MSEINFFKDVVEEVSNRFKNSNLGKLAEINKTNLNDYDAPIIQELNPPIKNKVIINITIYTLFIFGSNITLFIISYCTPHSTYNLLPLYS